MKTHWLLYQILPNNIPEGRRHLYVYHVNVNLPPQSSAENKGLETEQMPKW